MINIKIVTESIKSITSTEITGVINVIKPTGDISSTIHIITRATIHATAITITIEVTSMVTHSTVIGSIRGNEQIERCIIITMINALNAIMATQNSNIDINPSINLPPGLMRAMSQLGISNG